MKTNSSVITSKIGVSVGNESPSFEWCAEVVWFCTSGTSPATLILCAADIVTWFLCFKSHVWRTICGAHSWGVPRCHCPLEIPSICRSLLATLQLLRRFCFGLRASSSNVQQPASLRIHRQSRNTEYSAKEHPHTHTRCKAQRKSQRWCSTTQTARWYNVLSFQTNDNLITLHWRYLIYDHSTSPRRNPSSLVNVLDPPRAAALVPCRWHAGTATAPIPTSVRDKTQCNHRNYHTIGVQFMARFAISWLLFSHVCNSTIRLSIQVSRKPELIAQ